MGDNSVKNSRIKILKPHAHFHIIGRKSTKFQVNPIKDVGRVAETRSLGRTDRRMDGITHTPTDKGHFFSPYPPTSGDNKNLIPISNGVLAHMDVAQGPNFKLLWLNQRLDDMS